MAIRDAPRIGRMASGQPFTSPLRDVRTVSRKMVGHLADNVLPCRPAPGQRLNGEVATVTRLCLDVAVRMLDGEDVPETITRLEGVVEQWARQGIALDVIQRSVYETFRIGADLLHSGATPADFESVRDSARRQLDILELITTTITRAYIRELRSVVGEHHTAAHTLTTALLSGHTDSGVARRCGIDIAERYHVVAVAIAPHDEERTPGLAADIAARRKLRRVQSELAARCGGAALALLGVTGGTVLVPTRAFGDDDLDDLIESLSTAAGAPVTAATMSAPPESIPDTAREVHDMLDTARTMQFRRGLYRLSDIAIHHQMTRPGRALDHLREVLDPVAEHPELMQTLTCHLANNLNRRSTARALDVHPNTVDYRLKRIGQLTDCDPTRLDGLIYLHSALIARIAGDAPAGTGAAMPPTEVETDGPP
ncbi:PucR family transcriptional regulator [Nocardia bovistercoris]|uniref:Helix-turn-helix domain-containing protein n=1 Tax=Nocardia bovistercoris TaxID=2785916 RepID=A0A931IC95_9NOCA|nr:helix-turn-helix domain-containing protein [Nocardia bovistercoris]MBH0777780.1 helix-turn-helix domain-containing protein [Nocardia bovistercoris]